MKIILKSILFGDFLCFIYLLDDCKQDLQVHERQLVQLQIRRHFGLACRFSSFIGTFVFLFCFTFIIIVRSFEASWENNLNFHFAKGYGNESFAKFFDYVYGNLMRFKDGKSCISAIFFLVTKSIRQDEKTTTTTKCLFLFYFRFQFYTERKRRRLHHVEFTSILSRTICYFDYKPLMKLKLKKENIVLLKNLWMK